MCDSARELVDEELSAGSRGPFESTDVIAPHRLPTLSPSQLVNQTVSARRAWVFHMLRMHARLASELPNRTLHRVVHERAARNICLAQFTSAAEELALMPRLY